VNAEEVFKAVPEFLDNIEKVTLQAVFLEWMDWLRKYIRINGEHPDEAKKQFMQIRVLFAQWPDTHFLPERRAYLRKNSVAQVWRIWKSEGTPLYPMNSKTPARSPMKYVTLWSHFIVSAP
jgi:hypothetical protein